MAIYGRASPKNFSSIHQTIAELSISQWHFTAFLYIHHFSKDGFNSSTTWWTLIKCILVIAIMQGYTMNRCPGRQNSIKNGEIRVGILTKIKSGKAHIFTIFISVSLSTIINALEIYGFLTPLAFLR